MPNLAGDYQTQVRIAAKLKAIPLPELQGKTVLDVGTDHGYWSQLASERGATRVVGIDRGREVRGKGFVDLAARNNAQGWANCSFINVNLGDEWPDLGKFDVIFTFSIYHHLYGQCGSHDQIWGWLAGCLAPGGILLWEGPPDERDSTSRQVMRIKRRKNYSRSSIIAAAGKYFKVELIGPALHQPHREVWRCIPLTAVGPHDPRSGVLGDGEGAERLHRGTDAGHSGPDGVVPVRGDSEPQAESTNFGDRADAGTPVEGDGARDTNRPAPVVARSIAAVRGSAVHGRSRAGSQNPHPLLRNHRTAPFTFDRAAHERRASLLHPEWALIIGGGSEIWKDVERWEKEYGQLWDGLVIAANDIGSYWPRPLDHWVSLHPDKFRTWRPARTTNGHPDGYVTWGRRLSKVVDQQLTAWAGGSSGMLAAQLAFHLGCTKIILCGIPMTQTPHFAESTEFSKNRTTWTAAAGHWKAWERTKDRFEGKMRSMGGRTRELLGAPTKEWLLV